MYTHKSKLSVFIICLAAFLISSEGFVTVFTKSYYIKPLDGDIALFMDESLHSLHLFFVKWTRPLAAPWDRNAVIMTDIATDTPETDMLTSSK